MSFQSLLIDEVQVLPFVGSGTDLYGNPVDTFGEPVTYPARVEQAGSRFGSGEENLDDRDTRKTPFRVFLPADAAVDALDVIQWQGFTHRVNGRPNVVEDGVGSHHIELRMERIEG